VQIQPGDTTLPHTHDSAILYTHLHGPTGPSSGRVISDTRYVQEPLTHEVSNEGPGLLHILALANYGEGRQSKRQPDGLSVRRFCKTRGLPRIEYGCERAKRPGWLG
jgi:hypothetical protein